jgi:hypothetical protein
LNKKINEQVTQTSAHVIFNLIQLIKATRTNAGDPLEKQPPFPFVCLSLPITFCSISQLLSVCIKKLTEVENSDLILF